MCNIMDNCKTNIHITITQVKKQYYQPLKKPYMCSTLIITQVFFWGTSIWFTCSVAVCSWLWSLSYQLTLGFIFCLYINAITPSHLNVFHRYSTIQLATFLKQSAKGPKLFGLLKCDSNNSVYLFRENYKTNTTFWIDISK